MMLSAMLNRAALIHSQDMAKNDFFEHEGSDGSKVGDRASRVGYRWRAVAENIAIGAETAEIVVEGWLRPDRGALYQGLKKSGEPRGAGTSPAPTP